MDEGEDGVHMLDHRMRRSLNLMRGGELSDSEEESSGISLTDFNLEDIQGEWAVSRFEFERIDLAVTSLQTNL